MQPAERQAAGAVAGVPDGADVFNQQLQLGEEADFELGATRSRERAQVECPVLAIYPAMAAGRLEPADRDQLGHRQAVFADALVVDILITMSAAFDQRLG